jgi:hypothetical protein
MLIAQGHVNNDIDLEKPGLHYFEAPMLLRNAGDHFVDVSDGSGEVFRRGIAGRGLAVGDIDNDGRIDAVITTNDGPALLLSNQTKTGNHWLTLKLTGHESNRDGIGAVVTVTTASQQQTAVVTTASSYLSSSDKRVHFGLGDDDQIKRLAIHWPSGREQVLDGVKADQILAVDEPVRDAGRK